MTDRLVAAGGTLLLLAALVILWVARLGVHRELYVSELGAQGQPTAQWFQVMLLLIVAGASLIGWAGRGIRSRPRLLRLWAPSVSLWVAAGFFLVDSQVNCTPGCPQPFGPMFDPQDFVHTIAAVFAFTAACWAIFQCSFAVGHPALARFSLVASIAVAAISSAGGLMSVFNFYAVIGSRFEIVATTIGLAWILVFGVSLVFGASRSAAQGGEQLLGVAQHPVDLVLIPIHPPHLGLGVQRDEALMPFPDDQGALGA